MISIGGVRGMVCGRTVWTETQRHETMDRYTVAIDGNRDAPERAGDGAMSRSKEGSSEKSPRAKRGCARSLLDGRGTIQESEENEVFGGRQSGNVGVED
jgi:hypothetical protein